ncbi:GNAT family N-acetyltransferase [Terrabacter aerolatus]|uniref:GCN5-related N-acetyltransferase n=1 Tax=Terrabacter aerolatus TaxID=422442 RepID=A0A512D3R3_9MICO|nr:GNAT family N-acetyltransferase [Terrabacter aerolatus]GEO30910.1 GCN5-related N-acetyltransferase [Terrabacter aerolatus]
MHITVEDLADPVDTAVIDLLDGHVSQLRSISPPESTHALDLDGLRAPGVSLWVARDGDEVLGCGALTEVAPGHGEVKSMRTAPRAQRRGVARAVLAQILAEARRRGLSRVSLETGSDDFFAPARALYAAHGFTECGPFGSYRLDPHSTFLTLEL